MTTSRFCLTNYCAAATVKNGSGGGAPIRNESGSFTMERALNADRRSLWKSGNATGSATIDVDLGGIKNVRVAAVLGLTTTPADDSGSLQVFHASTYYPAAWTQFESTTLYAAGARDVGIVSATNVQARYWRFLVTLDTTTDITLGRIFLGTYAAHDLGGRHSPGGGATPFQNRVEQAMADGSYNVNTIGFPGRDFTLPFNQVPAATRDKMLAVAGAEGSVVFVDAEDGVYEVIVPGGRCAVTQSGLLYNVALELRRLP